MSKLLTIFFLFGFTFNSFSMEDNFLSFGNKNFAKEKSKKSKWSFKTGAEYIGYKGSLPRFVGVHDTIRNGDLQDVLGIGFSFGREFYLGRGFALGLGLGLTYAKTLSRDISNAASDLDIEIANTRRSHLFTTGEIQGSISYLFDNKFVDIQPFVEGAMGIGFAELDYEYNREPEDGANSDENYRARSDEAFALTKFSLGLNLISYKGLVTYIKVTTAMLLINNRDIDGSVKPAGVTGRTDLSSSSGDIEETSFLTMASLGLGYLF